MITASEADPIDRHDKNLDSKSIMDKTAENWA